ncbi:tryptophanase [Mycobacterium sp. ACS1612]|uniref:tryptophanase n=1 Tax=Mycobacterium sp. ACS1612 TaxID=1834117 RepID=UPI001E481AB1|nr:tryptophanase [Mycobacterium sp. ACS1612]
MRSTEPSLPAPTTVDVSIVSDADMAWMLAEAVDVCLTGHERTMTFVELGSGENHLAIERILNAVMSSRMTLPAAIFDRLTSWLRGYAGSPEEPQLRAILAEVWTQRLEPVPLRIQQAQCGDARRTAGAGCRVSVMR